MTRRTILLTLSALALTAGAAGCDGCAEPLSEIPGGLPIDDGDGAEPRVLSYLGDNPLVLYRGDSGLLQFTWKTESGLPVAGDAITVSVEGDAVTLSAESLTTDAGGGASVRANAGSEDGDALVIARAVDVDGSVDEARVTVRVQEDPAGALVVTVTSTARIPVVGATARVLVGANPPTCAQLQLSPEPAAQASADYTTVPGAHTFEGLTSGLKATVIADGRSASGYVVARGCAEAGVIVGGLELPVSVVLTQGETVVAGDYDVLMHVALGDALPAPYDATVDLITALLGNPAGYAVYIVLREVDQSMGTGFVSTGGVAHRFRDLEQNPTAFGTWNLATNALDNLLEDQLGQTYVDVTNVGAGVRDVVSDFEIGTRLSVDETAVGLTVDERWRDIVLYWPLPCDEGDLACARRPLTLDDLELAPVVTGYGASIAHAPVVGETERYLVSTDPHGLDVRYGALLLAILEQVVFPSLPPDVAGDSFGDVLTNLVGCANIGQSFSSDPFVQALVAGVCEGALNYAGQEIEDQLLQLQVDAVNPALGEEGLSAGGSMVLVDHDRDLTAELVDDYLYNVAWNYPSDPAATADIAAPINGDGLRSRTACVDDAVCGAGASCVARGSYLKVAVVELGCERAKGVEQGGESCVGDADCASGLCTTVGVGNALACYEACNANADCASGMICGVSGGSLDLDAVLPGLGEVEAPGCAAP
ncbi:MAG: hypothetical protein HYS27_05425 [Deltaproteobacteria bacterium]|nr:hypothetical protein [Deltaproteobacteria bacterium]